jgi:hypothetical protein
VRGRATRAAVQLHSSGSTDLVSVPSSIGAFSPLKANRMLLDVILHSTSRLVGRFPSSSTLGSGKSTSISFMFWHQSMMVSFPEGLFQFLRTFLNSHTLTQIIAARTEKSKICSSRFGVIPYWRSSSMKSSSSMRARAAGGWTRAEKRKCRREVVGRATSARLTW